MIDPAALRAALTEPIAWEGDLEDDCFARWRGMVAWAESMGCHCECSASDDDQDQNGMKLWAFGVRRDREHIYHSGDDGTHTLSGVGARAFAELIMRLAEIERLIR